MGVNIGSITGKIKKFADSPAGKKKMADSIQQIRSGNGVSGAIGKTQAGDDVITYEQMQAAAKELVALVRRHAASASLPPSVMTHVESFIDSPLVIHPDGSASIEINMLDDARRPSVQPESYDGAYNIVALFNKGYTAGGSIYGRWESAERDIWTKQHREGLFFLQKAINEFNSKYAAKYNVSVRLDGQYE